MQDLRRQQVQVLRPLVEVFNRVVILAEHPAAAVHDVISAPLDYIGRSLQVARQLMTTYKQYKRSITADR